MSDLIDRISAAQREAGERVVMEDLKAKGLTLGKLILDTARGDVKQRTLSPEEAQQVRESIARYFKGPLRFVAPVSDSDLNGPHIVDADGSIVAKLFWPCHLPQDTEAAEKATYALGELMAAVAAQTVKASQT